MPDPIDDPQSHGTTLEQRKALVAAYQRTGNLSAAARDVGIRSRRTAYLWFRRYQQFGDAGLVPHSRARKTQRTVRDDVAARAIELKRAHPDWGKGRIARDIASEYHGPVVSPSGVEAVLRRNGLWTPAKRPVAEPDKTRSAIPLRSGHAELDAMLPLVIKGIEASLDSRAAPCIALLGDAVWSRLGTDRHAWSRFLSDPAVGPLLLRSRVELGRSLMNTGRWREAAQMLEETLGWLRQAAPEGRECSQTDAPPGISLRRSDAWLETYQYLGIVLRNRAPAVAQGYLHIALNTIRSSSKRLVPLHPALIEGNLERDLARHLLRREESEDVDIARHLERSRRVLEAVGDVAMLAATDMGWADLEGRRAQRLRDNERKAWTAALDAMEAASERALAVFETIDSPMLHANFLTDASRLSVTHGLTLDRRRVRQAAQYCITFGYGGQARQLIALPGVDRMLASDALDLLTRLARGTDGNEARAGQDQSW